jgi:RND family efflux transporter MFP subunit
MDEHRGAARGTGSDDRVVELDSAHWRQLLAGDEEEAFFGSWLALQAQQLPRVLSAILITLSDEGQLRPVSFWPKGTAPGLGAIKAAESAARRGIGVVRRNDEHGQAGDVVCSFAYPVTVGDEVAAVAAFNLGDVSEHDLQSALRRVQWGAVWLENHFREQQASQLGETTDQLAATLDLVAVALEHKSAEAAALAFATETAVRLGCERASIGFRRGKGCRVAAVSHTADISRRQNLVRGIAAAMEESVDQCKILVFPPAGEDHSVLVKHRELSQRLGAGGPVVTVPLHDDDAIFGAVTIEYPPEKIVTEPEVDALNALCAIAGRVLYQHRREERLLVTKAGELVILHLGRLIGPGYLWRKLALIALAAATVFFAVYHTEFHVPAKATIEGEVQRVITAPYDGYIADESARPGDIVHKGQVLARLDDRELQLELAAWQSRRAQYEAERQSSLAERDIAAARVYEAQITEADVQIALAKRKIGFSAITAPFDGVVLSGDLSQALGSGVRLGDSLFQIAPLSSFRVVLKVDEEDITEVAAGERGQLVLGSHPEESLPFRVTKVTSVTQPEDGRNYFRLEARLDGSPSELLPGMQGIAKINAGERLLIWIWTRRAINWARVHAWKWLP